MKVKWVLNRLGSFIVTREIFEDKNLLKLLYKYFLIGLIIRFIFIPFFMHTDLLSTFRRAAETVFAGNIGSDFQQFLTNIIHSAYLFVARFFIPDISSYSNILLDPDASASWINFISSNNVFIVLSLFKSLYLFFDIICMFLIIRLLYDGEAGKKLKVFKYWALNPIVIFVSFIFARHDVIGIFVTLVAILLAKYKRKYWAIAVLALAVAVRFFPIMILPLLIFYLADRKKDYIILFSIGISGLVAIEAFSYIYFNRSVIFSLLNTEHFNFILSSKLELIVHDRIFLFVAVYIIIILSFLHLRKKSFDVFLNYCAIVYLMYVSLCYFHPQYLLWMVPFLILIFVRKNYLLYYHWVQFGLLLFILIYWGDGVTKFLLTPIDSRYFIFLTGPIPIVNRFYDPAKFVNIFRSIFTGVSLWMVYLIYRENRDILLKKSLHVDKEVKRLDKERDGKKEFGKE